MESLYIEGTKKTPEIDFKANGQLKLKGRSIPEDPSKFYDVLLHWVIRYSAQAENTTLVDIELEYFNSGTSKALFHILKLLAELKDKGKEIKFRWIYETGDEDIFERGEYYSSLLEQEFEFIEIDNNEGN